MIKLTLMNALTAFGAGFLGMAALLAMSIFYAYAWDCFSPSITENRLFERPAICSEK